MAPVKKQKVKKSSKAVKEDVQSTNQSVVSGQLQKKINKKQLKAPKDPKGVVFVKNLPHGFFEEQLKKYFEQFGDVSRVRLARSKRTGNSKGYAFVEFEYPEVAEVAAETMDNYLMFKHVVKASYIPPEKQQFNYFRSSVKRIRNKAGKLIWVSRKTASLQHKVKKQNDWSDENYQKRTEKQLAKLKKIGEKYAHLGIDVNNLIVQPKISVKAESNELGSSKPIKRKLETENPAPNKQAAKKLKNKVALEDLLGNTIGEDSFDDDWVAGSENDSLESGESSDEETYGFVKDSESEVELNYSESENENDREEVIAKPTVMPNKLKKKEKPLKNSSLDRLDEILKRKPHAGGIKKTNKKLPKQPQVENKKKAALKMAAAKEMAKPLSKVKTKLNGPLKSKKRLIKSK